MVSPAGAARRQEGCLGPRHHVGGDWNRACRDQPASIAGQSNLDHQVAARGHQCRRGASARSHDRSRPDAKLRCGLAFARGRRLSDWTAARGRGTNAGGRGRCGSSIQSRSRSTRRLREDETDGYTPPAPRRSLLGRRQRSQSMGPSGEKDGRPSTVALANEPRRSSSTGGAGQTGPTPAGPRSAHHVSALHCEGGDAKQDDGQCDQRDECDEGRAKAVRVGLRPQRMVVDELDPREPHPGASPTCRR